VALYQYVPRAAASSPLDENDDWVAALEVCAADDAHRFGSCVIRYDLL
jgi:hypothetical protein